MPVNALSSLAKRLGPQYVIPIHDWHLDEGGKRWLNGTAQRALAIDKITLLPLNDFETTTVDVG